MEIKIIGRILGYEYGARGSIQEIDQLLKIVKNTIMLRAEYPDVTDEQLEKKMI